MAQPISTELARERLIVALDVATARQAHELVNTLRGSVGVFKIGLQLFCAAGPEFVQELVQRGERIFLDLKFHDIPNTVAAAGVEATRLGVFMFNVHAQGGVEMMQRTSAAVNEIAAKEGLPKPYVIAVTVLTSANDATLVETGVNATAEDQVIRLARLTQRAGLDGVVASPNEVRSIRTSIDRATDQRFLIVTPGVRPTGTDAADQKRIMTPRAALASGSDYLVVGRPITAAADPVAAVEGILADMALGLADARGQG